MGIDAAPKDLDAVRAILARHVPDREVRVFGSRVTGPVKPFSDLDLVLMGDEPLDLLTRAALVDAFDESDLPFRVDLVEWASTADAFRELIDRQAVKLCGPQNQPLARPPRT